MGFLDKLFGGKTPQKPRTLREAEALLNSCGIRLKPGFTLDKLLDNSGMEEAKLLDLEHLLGLMGVETDLEPLGFPGLNVMCFDMEWIEDEGSFAEALRIFSEMCEGLLQFTDVVDNVECDTDSFIEFSCNGARYRVEFYQDSDWFSEEVLHLLEALYCIHGGGKRLAYVVQDDPGQEIVFVVVTPQDARRLQAHGLTLEVMETQLPLKGVTLHQG